MCLCTECEIVQVFYRVGTSCNTYVGNSVQTRHSLYYSTYISKCQQQNRLIILSVYRRVLRSCEQTRTAYRRIIIINSKVIPTHIRVGNNGSRLSFAEYVCHHICVTVKLQAHSQMSAWVALGEPFFLNLLWSSQLTSPIQNTIFWYYFHVFVLSCKKDSHSVT